MKELLFNHLNKRKDGTVNYDRLSKISGLSKADLMFLVKGDFNLLDRAYLISGVLVGYHPVVQNSIFPSRWDLRTCHNASEDLTYISSLISNHGNNFNTLYEYFIMDSAGGIISSNLKVESQVDDNGVIHLSSEDESLNQYVYPAVLRQCQHKCYYCHNEDMTKLNKQIKNYSDQKLIVKPSEFKGGFTQPSEQPQERNQ